MERDENYFRCYGDIAIHREMIADSTRTNTYKFAILKNYDKIYGKVVLDVGAGTGILSIFCVLAGARKVYAVEASSVAQQARKVIESNNMQEKITVINQRVEDIVLPGKVDVIVSEWMGYCLLYEAMLPSVLFARDKWLKPEGYLLPNKARLFIAPVCDEDVIEEQVDFWDGVKDTYGVDMSAMRSHAEECLTSNAHIKTVPPEHVVARGAEVLSLDLATISRQCHHRIQSDFQCSCYGHNQVNGFVFWFEVEFPHNIKLTTSPFTEYTHWQQTVIYIKDALPVEQDTLISGTVQLSPCHKRPRCVTQPTPSAPSESSPYKPQSRQVEPTDQATVYNRSIQEGKAYQMLCGNAAPVAGPIPNQSHHVLRGHVNTHLVSRQPVLRPILPPFHGAVGMCPPQRGPPLIARHSNLNRLMASRMHSNSHQRFAMLQQICMQQRMTAPGTMPPPGGDLTGVTVTPTHAVWRKTPSVCPADKSNDLGAHRNYISTKEREILQKLKEKREKEEREKVAIHNKGFISTRDREREEEEMNKAKRLKENEPCEENPGESTAGNIASLSLKESQDKNESEEKEESQDGGGEETVALPSEAERLSESTFPKASENGDPLKGMTSNAITCGLDEVNMISHPLQQNPMNSGVNSMGILNEELLVQAAENSNVPIGRYLKITLTYRKGEESEQRCEVVMDDCIS